MDADTYDAVLNYLQNGTLPDNYSSTKGNFIVMASNYQVNGNGRLLRNHRLVVREDEIDVVFRESHSDDFSLQITFQFLLILI